MTKNLLCKESDIKNESGVELFFVMPLLKTYLEYKDKDIRTKETIDALSVSSGRKRVLYRPDFAITQGGHVRWICDAKAPKENLDSWKGQCKSYCHELNARYETGENPVMYYMLTNGRETKVYPWDSDRAVVTLQFEDFVQGGGRFQKLCALLSAKKPDFMVSPEKPKQTLVIKKKSANELNADFSWCHDQIHKKDALSYTAAFMEFVKLIFLKLLSDKKLHEKMPEIADPGVEAFQVVDPASNVNFSLARIVAAEAAGIENPMAIEFDTLREDLEVKIKQQHKKRIFPENEKLGLSSDLVRDIVKRLETTDLYGLDADLNGRLFETFLNATLRGKALGQYFTPRSVVKLATAMANLKVGTGKNSTDVVIDGCCGSGGFLIEALASMWNKVDEKKGMSLSQKAALKDAIATKCMFGIDSAKDPALARIARMNMYLHGDGGSAIFQLDALDKSLNTDGIASSEVRSELHDFKRILEENSSGFADVALTNPPFARDYERKARKGGKTFNPSVLDSYELSYEETTSKPKMKLKSSAMFLERYLDFLKPGGRLITVIDDSVLGGKAFSPTRAWLRRKYVVEAVVSLPGDAFQRSEARVKTSILVLRKRLDESEVQGDVFMYYSQFVGVDDPARERVLPADEDNHKKAIKEIERISELFGDFLNGTPAKRKLVAAHVVPFTSLEERWDVKACLLKPGRLVRKWRMAKVRVEKLSALVRPVFIDGQAFEDPADARRTAAIAARVLRPRSDAKTRIIHLRMSYRGAAEMGEEKFSTDTDASYLFKVAEGDLVISHINALHGAMGIVPKELDGAVVTNEYTVLRAIEGVDSRILCSILRSADIRSDIILTSTGIGRTRATWTEMADLMIPLPPKSTLTSLSKKYDQAESLAKQAKLLLQTVESGISSACMLGDPKSSGILEAFKPPQ